MCDFKSFRENAILGGSAILNGCEDKREVTVKGFDGEVKFVKIVFNIWKQAFFIEKFKIFAYGATFHFF